MMINKPYYEIDFSATACMFEIRINDYPVINMNINGQVSTRIPINYTILESGDQIISATILPILGTTILNEEAELRFNIKLFDVENDFVFQEQFGEYQSEKIETSKIPLIKYDNVFKADVPYKLKAWQKGKNLKNIEDCREKLEFAYEKLRKMIQEEYFEDYVKSIYQRELNMATSMYLTKEEAKGRINELINDFNSGFEIQPIPKDSVMSFYAENRVVILKKINGDSALYLENKETQEELILDLSFYIPEGKDDFEII